MSTPRGAYTSNAEKAPILTISKRAYVGNVEERLYWQRRKESVAAMPTRAYIDTVGKERPCVDNVERAYIDNVEKSHISNVVTSLYRRCGKGPIAIMSDRVYIDNAERAYLDNVARDDIYNFEKSLYRQNRKEPTSPISKRIYIDNAEKNLCRQCR